MEITVNLEDYVRQLRRRLSKRSGDQITLTRAQLRARFRRELPALSKEEIAEQIQHFRLSLEHLTEDQERSDHKQKMLAYNRFLKSAQTWELEHACRLVVSPLDFKRFGIRVSSEGADFAITVKYSEKPAPKGCEGHRMVIRRYMSEALAGIPTSTKRAGKTMVTGSDFLAWAEEANYIDRIPDEICDACRTTACEGDASTAANDDELSTTIQNDVSEKSSEILTEKQRLVLEVLQSLSEHEARTAKQIADTIAESGGPVLCETSIKNHYISSLRKKGHKIGNRPGAGYFLEH